MSNFTRPPRRSWPYAFTAVLVVAVQQGWAAPEIVRLAATVLVFIAVIYSVGEGGDH
ncbi:hypothetical protein ACFYXV_31040 [Streptomyces sp. NPDC002181]|uniref:hypothetical protein n=1 Tax=unclassified Streptomyces TaxID=2593676 RepID=UPI00364B25CA